ncbi:hypothetical protein [Kibdelosporangium phytohabitans]|uniref:PE domain-containing protein n=1 Tax=Kibdelosporangium phytohabitans TaxID=860235 RepID=A0A0N7F439_9PSEU|nr:hypothetical protein [Kibdelosporangium phytohabitans]ALG10359.1 hypothetical protein AOZ06_28790 [Kibdelosporangium phytohabitans]MBE1461407.1 hypothetical protein [Kibdelosporangium phytohabitans]
MTTKLNVEAVKEAAAHLSRIMDDMSAFTALQAAWPKIGNFDQAQHLEGVVDDRRRGVVGHVGQLKVSLDEMQQILTRIATGFETLDQNNAREIEAAVPNVPGRRTAV